MLQKHSFLSKFSGGSTPDPCKGSASRLLENASKALIFVKIFWELHPRPLQGLCLKITGKCFKSTHFCQNFPGALPPTPARALPLDCWKMLQKHSFVIFVKIFWGAPPPTPARAPPQDHWKMLKKHSFLSFCQNFLGALPPTPARALPLDCWKMLQKHSFLSKFSGAPPLISIRALPLHCWKILQKH